MLLQVGPRKLKPPAQRHEVDLGQRLGTALEIAQGHSDQPTPAHPRHAHDDLGELDRIHPPLLACGGEHESRLVRRSAQAAASTTALAIVVRGGRPI
jgi:hypothetical protein